MTTPSAAIRERLGHPVVDADGHAIESTPLLLEYLRACGGPKLADRFVERVETGGWAPAPVAERARRRIARPSAWTLPTRNTLDRATAMLPRLLRTRLDDFGIDFAIVYSTLALGVMSESDDDLRRGCCRALNLMFADVFREHADRMTPVATIPAFTPDEALEELEFAVRTLGFKAVMIDSNVRRPIPAASELDPQLGAYATYIDTLALDSPYDYDPVWAKCMELKVAVTAHTPGMGYGSRVSTTNYAYNHIGNFAEAGAAFAKALVLGGVTKRFPRLNFAFLEGGVAWASELYAGLVSHCSKRNPTAIANYDPRNLDVGKLSALMATYATAGAPDPGDRDLARFPGGWHWDDDDLIGREWGKLGIERAEDLRPLFEPNFYFGCEADDPLVSVGFDRRLNPFGARLKAIFSSDIGHWDVPDMSEVLAEAYELVERGLLDEADFEEFTFTNPVMLHAGMNPDFFAGTVVEEAAAKQLAVERP